MSAYTKFLVVRNKHYRIHIKYSNTLTPYHTCPTYLYKPMSLPVDVSKSYWMGGKDQTFCGI